MDWKEASAYYKARLTDVLNVQRHAVELSDLPQTDISEEQKRILKDEFIPIKRQLERLEKNEFRIAVVGLEKSGKSTFINAWLDCDLLPAKGGRCTFTTTQIFSVQNDAQQKLEVRTKSEAQLNDLKNELKFASQNNEKAREDLNTIERCTPTLLQVIEEGDKEIPFTRLEDIKKPLQKYVADEKFAHAVHEVRLYTSKLAEAQGIVFYDVPGLDSGLAKHIEESREMLSDCDAVIVVQRFRNIRDAELQIIRFTEQGDHNIKVSDKLFVFLSHIDMQASEGAMAEHISEATRDWHNRAGLPQQRIVAGSAGSYLVLRKKANEQTLKEVGTPDVVKQRLTLLTGIDNYRQKCDQIVGIQDIKQRVFDYIDTERVEVLQKRCDTSVKKILTSAKEIREFVSRRYSDNPENAKRYEEDQERIKFSEWWENKWKQILSDLADYYSANIRQSTVSTNNNPVNLSITEDFYRRYLDFVNQSFEKFRERVDENRKLIFKANSVTYFDGTEVNFKWRDEIYIEISKLLLDISNELAVELRKEALQLVDHISSLMWNAPEVKLRLIKDADDYIAKLNHSLTVLFLRFARPMVEALIRGPLDSDKRKDITEKLGADIEILDNYYCGNKPEFSTLKRFAKYGMRLLYDLTIRERILGIQGVVDPLVDSVVEPLVDSVVDPLVDSVVDQITDFPNQQERIMEEITNPRSIDSIESVQSLVREVEADIMAVEVYLKEAVFEAAALKQYCIQELDTLRDEFINLKPVWNGVVMNEWLSENPQLLSELPDDLQALEVNIEISERLNQLTIMLNKIQN
ncbi:MAG: dynamin family protein [Xenococcus sp. MO_188.B8]|nr:dynamin family protein [Xenococcus sp. MO_188.B8]